jgi:hypothetical protein
MRNKSTKKRWAPIITLLGGLLAGVLASSMTAHGAINARCVGGEHIQMIDPVVTVISGPGEVVDEQSHWTLTTSLSPSYLEGPLRVAISETVFDLERVP